MIVRNDEVFGVFIYEKERESDDGDCCIEMESAMTALLLDSS